MEDKEDKKEWRVLVDPEQAFAIDDPTGTQYSFVIVRDDKIIYRESYLNGFNYGDDFRKRLRAELKAKLRALDEPFLMEKTTTTLVSY